MLSYYLVQLDTPFYSLKILGTTFALEQVNKRIAQFDAKYLPQIAYALNKLNINDLRLWNKISTRVHVMAHIFDTNALATFFDVLFPTPTEELEDDVLYYDKEVEKDQKSKRCNNIVLQQLINVIPLKVKELSKEQLVRVIETCTLRNLGDDDFYKEYLYFYIEKKSGLFNINQYVRLLRVLGERQYTDDLIFWNDYMFPRVYK